VKSPRFKKRQTMWRREIIKKLANPKSFMSREISN
jgi:hypothetical protein